MQMQSILPVLAFVYNIPTYTRQNFLNIINYFKQLWYTLFHSNATAKLVQCPKIDVGCGLLTATGLTSLKHHLRYSTVMMVQMFRLLELNENCWNSLRSTSCSRNVIDTSGSRVHLFFWTDETFAVEPREDASGAPRQYETIHASIHTFR